MVKVRNEVVKGLKHYDSLEEIVDKFNDDLNAMIEVPFPYFNELHHEQAQHLAKLELKVNQALSVAEKQHC